MMVVIKVAHHRPVHRCRTRLHRHGELAPVPAGQHGRIRRLRLVRRADGRRDHLLRLHRLRPGRTTAQEARNPQRDVPIGIIAALIISTVLYVAMSAVMTGMVHYDEARTCRRPWRWRSMRIRSSSGWACP